MPKSVAGILASWAILVALVVSIGPWLMGYRQAFGFSPYLILTVTVSALVPVGLAFQKARGTSLQGAILWGAMTLVLASISQAVAISEPASTGRPISGQFIYLATLTGLASAISVLNARRPGSGAWAILMGILVLVFLLPWLEGGGLARTEGGWIRLRLTAPWTIFYGLLVLAGVTNFLATRYFWGALIFGIGLIAMDFGLVRTDLEKPLRGMIWEFVALAYGTSVWVTTMAGSRRAATSDLARLWLWFRDHWGVVWGLRVMERFNKTAELSNWAIRLAWQGPVYRDGVSPALPDTIPPQAVATLMSLLRRFAELDRLESAAAGPCRLSEKV